MVTIPKITYSVVALLIVVLLTAVTIVPVINDIQNDITTTNTNATARYSAVVSTNDIDFEVVVVDVANEIYTINGVTVDTTTDSFWRVYSDDFLMSLSTTSINGVGFTSGSYSFADGDKMTIIDGAWTFDFADPEKTDITGEISTLIYRDANGTYGEFSSSPGGKKVNNDVTWYVYSQGSGQRNAVWEANRTTYSVLGQWVTSTGAETSAEGTATVTTTDYNDYAYQIESASFTLGSYTTATTLYFFPLEYTVVDTDSSDYVLLGIIPMLMFVLPIIMVVRMISGRRD